MMCGAGSFAFSVLFFILWLLFKFTVMLVELTAKVPL